MAFTNWLRTHIGAVVLSAAAVGCGDTYNTYAVSGNDDGKTENRSYVCEDFTAYIVQCYPPKEGGWEEQIDICQEMKFESTPEGHSFMDCSYDAQCNLRKLEECIQIVPGLD